MTGNRNRKRYVLTEKANRRLTQMSDEMYAAPTHTLKSYPETPPLTLPDVMWGRAVSGVPTGTTGGEVTLYRFNPTTNDRQLLTDTIIARTYGSNIAPDTDVVLVRVPGFWLAFEIGTSGGLVRFTLTSSLTHAGTATAIDSDGNSIVVTAWSIERAFSGQKGIAWKQTLIVEETEVTYYWIVELERAQLDLVRFTLTSVFDPSNNTATASITSDQPDSGLSINVIAWNKIPENSQIGDKGVAWRHYTTTGVLYYLLEIDRNPGIYVRNVSGYTVPPYGLMQVKRHQKPGDVGYFEVVRPKDTAIKTLSVFLVNGDTEIANNGYGLAQVGPMFRVQANSGSRAIGTRLGWIDSSFQAGLGCLLELVGYDTTNPVADVAWCMTDSSILIGTAGTAITTSTGTATASGVAYAVTTEGDTITSGSLVALWAVEGEWKAIKLC